MVEALKDKMQFTRRTSFAQLGLGARLIIAAAATLMVWLAVLAVLQ